MSLPDIIHGHLRRVPHTAEWNLVSPVRSFYLSATSSTPGTKNITIVNPLRAAQGYPRYCYAGPLRIQVAAHPAVDTAH